MMYCNRLRGIIWQIGQFMKKSVTAKQPKVRGYWNSYRFTEWQVDSFNWWLNFSHSLFFQHFLRCSFVFEAVKSIKMKNSEGLDWIPQRVIIDGIVEYNATVLFCLWFLLFLAQVGCSFLVYNIVHFPFLVVFEMGCKQVLFTMWRRPISVC